MSEELFQVKIGMWLEILLGKDWVVGQITDLTPDGKTVWVETHEDSYDVHRLGGKLRKLRF